ncbi:MAG TPA: methionine biosynthesis protein MetW [Spirochaetota bacterium]|nr:methionine biosynthesis protein MetW [Spirochaetota bacterium]HPJ35114.1 methionine biosynthesis protein MetW [Spirochaetota bacterium]
MEEFGIGYDLVISEIPEGVRVLDLGCGDGTLLTLLQEKKGVRGFGVEISEEGVSLCVEKGIYCYQADIDEGLSDYRDNSFDYVILNQTIQNTKRPDYVIREVLRIGKKAIISFPNFGYYRTRAFLMFRGTMPVNDLLPYQWYDSPNIHLLTIKDMTEMTSEFSFKILSEKHFSVTRGGKSKVINHIPNLLAQYGLFVIESIDN